jgi:hypothetical protein
MLRQICGHIYVIYFETVTCIYFTKLSKFRFAAAMLNLELSELRFVMYLKFCTGNLRKGRSDIGPKNGNLLIASCSSSFFF